MAQLKDSVVSGNLRVTDTTSTDTLQTTTIKAPTTSGGSSYGAGTNGQVMKSNGTSSYWGDDYSLPTASATVKGGIKVGDGLSITDGVLSAVDGATVMYGGTVTMTSGVSFGGSAILGARITGYYGTLSNTSPIDLEYPIVYTPNGLNGGQTAAQNSCILTGLITLSGSFTALLPVFLKGALDGSIFTSAGVYCQSGSSEESYHYLFMGIATASNKIWLSPVHDVYEYVDGAMQKIGGGGGGSTYVLPQASSSVLGGIKVGSGLYINASTGSLSIDSATTQKLNTAHGNANSALSKANSALAAIDTMTTIVNRPDYMISNVDLADGVSPLDAGKLYFYYED